MPQPICQRCCQPLAPIFPGQDERPLSPPTHGAASDLRAAVAHGIVSRALARGLSQPLHRHQLQAPAGRSRGSPAKHATGTAPHPRKEASPS